MNTKNRVTHETWMCITVFVSPLAFRSNFFNPQIKHTNITNKQQTNGLQIFVAYEWLVA